jgi:putative polyhydroxyalkanoate system protein
MADVKVTQPHSVGAAEAKTRIGGFEEMMSKYGVKADWAGNAAKLKGMGVSGSIDVTDSLVTVVVKLGMMAKAAGVKPDKLKASIEKRLKAAFEG